MNNRSSNKLSPLVTLGLRFLIIVMLVSLAGCILPPPFPPPPPPYPGYGFYR